MSAYFSFTTLRLTFSVGVSSPVACVRSWSRITNFLTCSTWAYFSFALSISAWISSCTFGLARQRGDVLGQAVLAREDRDLLLVERDQDDRVGALVAMHHGL